MTTKLTIRNEEGSNALQQARLRIAGGAGDIVLRPGDAHEIWLGPTSRVEVSEEQATPRLEWPDGWPSHPLGGLPNEPAAVPEGRQRLEDDPRGPDDGVSPGEVVPQPEASPPPATSPPPASPYPGTMPPMNEPAERGRGYTQAHPDEPTRDEQRQSGRAPQREPDDYNRDRT